MSTQAGKVRIRENVIAQHLGDEMVLLNTTTEDFISLNTTGAVIWESLVANGDSAAAVAAVGAAFELTGAEAAGVGDDVAEFIRQLQDLGVADVAPAA